MLTNVSCIAHDNNVMHTAVPPTSVPASQSTNSISQDPSALPDMADMPPHYCSHKKTALLIHKLQSIDSQH